MRLAEQQLHALEANGAEALAPLLQGIFNESFAQELIAQGGLQRLCQLLEGGEGHAELSLLLAELLHYAEDEEEVISEEPVANRVQVLDVANTCNSIE